MKNQIKDAYKGLTGYQKVFTTMEIIQLILMILFGPFIVIAKAAKLKIR